MTRRLVLARRVCVFLLAVAALTSSVTLHALPAAKAADSAGKRDASPSNSAVFLVAPSISVSGKPAAIVAGDVNGDGIPDLVVANAQTGNVDVLLGDGKGGFRAPAHYKVGGSPVALVLGDLSGHGKIDIAIANQSENSVSVLLGKGDGTFQPAIAYAVGAAPSSVAMGDFSGNGHADLVVANTGSNTLAVLTNKGDGTFQSAKVYGLASSPRSLVVADFNGDGKLDVASGNADGTVSILLGDGESGFKVSSSWSAATRASALVAGDFNGDGKTDLAVADPVANTVNVYLGRGDGTFQSGAVLPVGNEPTSLALGDVTGDGVPDLLVANKSGNTVSVMLGVGDGSFQPSFDYVVGNSPLAVAIADFNGDGHLDFATANSADGTVSVPLGKGDGSFQAAKDYRTHLERKSVAVGDLDGDGHPDLVVASFCGTDAKCSDNGTASVFLSDGKGSLKAASIYLLGKGPVSIALADINGDKKLDLIAVNRDEGTVMVLLGNGDGTFQEAASYPAGTSPVSVAVGDFNRDGKPDLAIATLCGSAGCHQPGSVNILLGNGDGSFKSGPSYDVGFSPAAVIVGDVDGDGNLDLVVANSCGQSAVCSNGTASVLLGDGKGSFAFKAEVELGKNVSSIALGDLNGDGKLDLISSNGIDNQAGVLLGKGDGTFGPLVPYGVGIGPSAVAVADFDGDGRLDVAVANLKDSTVGLLRGNGDGTLLAPVAYPVGLGPEALAALDLDGSGRLALVTANGNSGGSPLGNDITVLANAGASPTVSPVLAIVKSHQGNFSQGEIGATYSIVVSNNGSGPTDGTKVTVTDTIPTGLTATAISGTNWTCNIGPPPTCDRSDALPAGAKYETITLTVDVAGNAPASVTNKVKVAGGGSAAATASDVTSIGPPIPILAISKTHTDPFKQGQTGATYTITVTNNGGAPTNGTTVTVTDTLPNGLTATAISGTNWTCTLSALTCTRKDALVSGGSYDAITLTVSVAPNAPAQVTNVVSVTGGGFVGPATANDLTNITAQPVLSITKTHSGKFVQGDTGDPYSITVTNNGGAPTDGTTVTVTDSLPTGLTGNSITGTNWTCSIGPPPTCNRKDALAAGKSYEAITLTVDVAAGASGTLTNSVTVSGGGSGPATATDPTPITPAPVLAVKKSHTGSFTQGQTGTWMIEVDNTATGSQTSGTLTVTDTLPAGYTLANSNVNGWTCTEDGQNPDHVTCDSVQTVSGGSSYNTLDLAVNVPLNSPTSVKNSATASGGGALSPATSNTDMVTVIQVPASVTPTAGTPQAAVINNVFTVSLAVKVLDAGNQPIPNYTVTFVAPTSGASCTPKPAQPTTDSNGIATTICTANAIYGDYNVDATTANGIHSVPLFKLTNQDFTIVPAQVTAAVTEGDAAVPITTLTLTPQPVGSNFPYTGTVMLGCSALPTTSSCAFTPPVVTLPGTGTNGSATAAVTVTTAAATPIGLYSSMIGGTDTSKVPDAHSLPFSLSVECGYSVGNSDVNGTVPIFTPVVTSNGQTTSNPYPFTFFVTETSGGTGCSYGSPVAGGINPSPVLGTPGINIGSGASGTIQGQNMGSPVTYSVTAISSNATTPQLDALTVTYFQGTSTPYTQPQSFFVTQELIAPMLKLIVPSSGLAASGTGTSTVSAYSMSNLNMNNKSGYSINFAAVSGLTGTICNAEQVQSDGSLATDPSGANYGITCSWGQVPIQLTGGMVSVALTIDISSSTPDVQRRAQRMNRRMAPLYALGLGLPGIVFLSMGRFAFGRNRVSRIVSITATLMVVCLLLLLPACGGGFTTTVVQKGSATNQYTITAMGYVLDTNNNSNNVVGVEIFTIPLVVEPQQ